MQRWREAGVCKQFWEISPQRCAIHEDHSALSPEVLTHKSSPISFWPWTQSMLALLKQKLMSSCTAIHDAVPLFWTTSPAAYSRGFCVLCKVQGNLWCSLRAGSMCSAPWGTQTTMAARNHSACWRGCQCMPWITLCAMPWLLQGWRGIVPEPTFFLFFPTWVPTLLLARRMHGKRSDHI